jgi:MraZ protein
MIMFLGKHEYKVDNKGRLPLPPKFRKDIVDGLVLTMVADDCITVFSKEDFEKMTSNQLPSSFSMSDDQRRVNRHIFSNAEEVSIDNQGRIALPASLRERCGITSEAVILGISNGFEIWNTDNWKKEQISAGEARQRMNSLEERK